jgi:adenylate cyclase
MARASTFAYKKKPATIKQVAEELGVQYVIEGSIQKSEDQLRITVQIIDALTGYHVWSERYDKDIKDIFKIQDDISFNIVKKVAEKHSKAKKGHLDWRGIETITNTNNVDAYLKYLNASYTYNQKSSPENYAKAKRLCEEALALDSSFSHPYITLAWIHVREARYGFSASPEKSRKLAIKMAEKAVELDESNPDAYIALGRAYYDVKQFDKALAVLKRAEAIDPNTVGLIGWVHIWTGSPDKAVPYMKRYMRGHIGNVLGPFSVGAANIFMGKYEDAIPYYKEAIKISPGFYRLHLDLAACYAALGKEEEAKAATQQVLKIYAAFNVEKYIKNLPARSPEDIKYYTEALRKVPFPE